MIITLSWLKRHLDTNASVNTIAETLTRIGLEVESFTNNQQIYQPFIIAEIISTAQHPNADKLKVCTVFDGKSNIQIVCGAQNARAGIKVVLAPIGTVIPLNKMIIKESEIRGVKSYGMLCSAQELLLEDNSSGILELPFSAEVGISYIELEGVYDEVFDISITPNRGDATSVYGIARDLAACGVGTLKAYNHSGIKYNNLGINIIDKVNCSEFALVKLSNITQHKYTDTFIDKLLKSAGLSSKLPLVNISNFAMYDQGRPNHFYDADKIIGDISVRQSFEKEHFVALNGNDYILPEGLTVVCDEHKVLSVAGVMGGELSKVDENTTNILVEIANFSPKAIAQSGRILNLTSESRYRFERRVDFANTDFFIDYISKMLLQHFDAKSESISLAKGQKPNYIDKIKFDYSKVSKIAGLNIDVKTIENILTKLGFRIESDIISIPSYRQGDIALDVDLIEEILRIYGLDNIKSQNMSLSYSESNAHCNQFTQIVRNYLNANGFDEFITYSFTSKEHAKLFQNDTQLVVIHNPINSDMSVMRPSLLATLLKHLIENINHGIEDVRYFEIGNIYQGSDSSQQKSNVCGIRFGKSQRKTHYKEEREFDVFDVKSDISALIKLYGIDPDNCSTSRNTPSYYHPQKSASISLGKNLLGYFGQLHPSTLKEFSISTPVMAFELFVSNLPIIKRKSNKIPQSQKSNLQAIIRDFAFEIDCNTELGALLKAVKNSNPLIIDEVKLFDIYESTKLTAGKKSISFSVTMQPIDATFKQNEINDICQNIVSLIQLKYGGLQRL